jgi:EAL domain-containing protein (putative c-di-GMP-specific phosphodiesterase class I)
VEWRHRHPDQHLRLSVNLSARQFSQADLADRLKAILDATGFPPGDLQLEITESVVMERSEAGVSAVRRLHELGVRLALDDFGTGYSSLAYLRHLPLDALKIDRSFVAELDEGPEAAIVEAVVALAHGLGIEVVAEGIETPAQAARLRAMGCDRGQGYAYSPPLPVDEIADLLAGGCSALPRTLDGARPAQT